MAESYYNNNEAEVVMGDNYVKTIVCSSCLNINTFDRTNPKEMNVLIGIENSHREFECDTCLISDEDLSQELEDVLSFGPDTNNKGEKGNFEKPMNTLSEKEPIILPHSKVVEMYLDFKLDPTWFIHLKSYYAQNDWWLTFSIVTIKESEQGEIELKNKKYDIDEVLFNGIRTVKVRYVDNNDITEIIQSAYETIRSLKDDQIESRLAFDSLIYD